MSTFTLHRRLHPIQCAHCGDLSLWAHWRRIGDGEYAALCAPCQALGDATFTMEGAIAQARIIIAACHQVARAIGGVQL
jgi:hypothetical protein